MTSFRDGNALIFKVWCPGGCRFHLWTSGCKVALRFLPLLYTRRVQPYKAQMYSSPGQHGSSGSTNINPLPMRKKKFKKNLLSRPLSLPSTSPPRWATRRPRQTLPSRSSAWSRAFHSFVLYGANPAREGILIRVFFCCFSPDCSSSSTL